MKRYALALVVVLAVEQGFPASRALTTQQKIELIESEKAPRGSKILFPESELNRYVRDEVPRVVPEGVRNPKLSLSEGRASGTALIDFSKLRHAERNSIGWTILGRLLEGERPVTVTARIRSSEGTATVDLERVEISGSTISGRPLKMLLDMFVMPLYPEARIGEPFALRHGVDRIEVRPGLAQVLMRP